MKRRLKKLGKFFLTLGLGSLLTILITATQNKPAAPRAEKSVEYSHYLKGIFKTLRAERKIRMVNLELPASILSRRQVADEARSDFEIIARAEEIPVVAVSRNAKRFLEQMRVVTIDPNSLPPEVLLGLTGPLSGENLKRFVLIPDVSRANGQAFVIKSR